MSEELKVKFPKELTGIVKENDITFLGHGEVVKHQDKESEFGTV